MTYETFLDIAENLSDYINHHRDAFIDFGYCIKHHIIREEDIDYFRQLKKIYLDRNELLICAILVIRYPDETFENAKGEKTKIKYLLPNQFVRMNGNIVQLNKRNANLLDKAKVLHKFMMEI